MIAIHLTQRDYGKPLTKVALTFTLAKYLSANALIDVKRLNKFHGERLSADISAGAEMSARETRAPQGWGSSEVASSVEA
jgi:hypothetical protein